ncbi:hypothetical protein GCM10023080_040210 [Streptomyces pseudoechinosporeus]
MRGSSEIWVSVTRGWHGVMTVAEWLDHWMQQAPLLPGDRLRDLLDRLDDLDEEEE